MSVGSASAGLVPDPADSLQRHAINQLTRFISVSQEQLDALRLECEKSVGRLSHSEAQPDEAAQRASSGSVHHHRKSKGLQADLLLISVFNSRIAIERHKIELLTSRLEEIECGGFDLKDSSMTTLVRDVLTSLNNDQNILLLNQTMRDSQSELLRLQGDIQHLAMSNSGERLFGRARLASIARGARGAGAVEPAVEPLSEHKRVDGQLTMQLLTQVMKAPRAQPAMEMLQATLKNLSKLEGQNIHCFVNRLHWCINLDRDVDKKDLKLYNAAHRKVCSFRHTSLYVNTAPDDVSGFVEGMVDLVTMTQSPTVTHHEALVCLDQYIFPQVFEVCMSLVACKEEDDFIAAQCALYSTVPQQAIGIHDAFVDPSMVPWSIPIAKLRTLSLCQSPLKMLYSILSAAESVFSYGAEQGMALQSADDFFPIFVYVVLHARPTNLATILRFIDKFAHKDVLLAELGYSFSNLWAAAEFVKSLDADSLLPMSVSTQGRAIFTPDAVTYRVMLGRMKGATVEVSEETHVLVGFRAVVAAAWVFEAQKVNFTFLAHTGNPHDTVEVVAVRGTTSHHHSSQNFDFLWEKHFHEEIRQHAEVQEIVVPNTIPPVRGWAPVLKAPNDVPRDLQATFVDGHYFHEDVQLLKTRITLQRVGCNIKFGSLQDLAEHPNCEFNALYPEFASPNPATSVFQLVRHMRTALALIGCLPVFAAPFGSQEAEQILSHTNSSIRRTGSVSGARASCASSHTLSLRSVSSLCFFDNVLQMGVSKFQREHNARAKQHRGERGDKEEASAEESLDQRPLLGERSIELVPSRLVVSLSDVPEDGNLTPETQRAVDCHLSSVWARLQLYDPECADPVLNPCGFMDAVRRFQQDHAVFADGVAGEKTRGMLMSLSMTEQLDRMVVARANQPRPNPYAAASDSGRRRSNALFRPVRTRSMEGRVFQCRLDLATWFTGDARQKTRCWVAPAVVQNDHLNLVGDALLMSVMGPRNLGDDVIGRFLLCALCTACLSQGDIEGIRPKHVLIEGEGRTQVLRHLHQLVRTCHTSAHPNNGEHDDPVVNLVARLELHDTHSHKEHRFKGEFSVREDALEAVEEEGVL